MGGRKNKIKSSFPHCTHTHVRIRSAIVSNSAGVAAPRRIPTKIHTLIKCFTIQRTYMCMGISYLQLVYSIYNVERKPTRIPQVKHTSRMCTRLRADRLITRRHEQMNDDLEGFRRFLTDGKCRTCIHTSPSPVRIPSTRSFSPACPTSDVPLCNAADYLNEISRCSRVRAVLYLFYAIIQFECSMKLGLLLLVHIILIVGQYIRTFKSMWSSANA